MIAFDSGQSVREGDVLAKLDTRQERAQLAAAEAQRELARVNFERMQGLLDEQVVSRAEFDRATADLRQGEARVGEIRATIDRKTIRAPFTGLLGIRHVNRGQYLSAGDALVTLQSLNPIYVNFGVPQQAMAELHVGRDVRISSADGQGRPVSRDTSPPWTRSSTRRRATCRRRRRSPTRAACCGQACSCRRR